ncbi:MAG: ArsR/SmtB family transcription factor [Phycisphaerales bacterium JB038]
MWAMDRHARPSRMTVGREDQWSAMCSGPRLEIVMALSTLGRASAAEVGYLLDKAPDTLYHHLRVLERADLVRACDHRRVGRQTETVYELTADELHFDVDFPTGKNTDRAVKLVDTHLKRARRITAEAFRSGVASTRPESRNTHVRGDLAWLDDDEVQRVTEIVNELRDLFARAKQRRHGKLHAFTFVFSPVHRERGADARHTHRLETMLEREGLEHNGLEQQGADS